MSLIRPGEASRPISFVFNGGPGAAAAFLHLGALGPKVLNFTEDGAAPAQPLGLSENPDSWLAFTDLVFVDPVGTGYSRVTQGGAEAEKAYYGVDQDADAMAEFVKLYLARTGRELAPVYLVGESYGGFRAVLVARRLLEGGIGVKGAVLVSPALEFSMIRGDAYALLPLALQLPSIAASHLEATAGHDAPLDAVHEAEILRDVRLSPASRARLKPRRCNQGQARPADGPGSGSGRAPSWAGWPISLPARCCPPAGSRAEPL